MLRDRRLRHLEDLDEAVDVELTVIAMGELFDDTNSGFVTESAEDLRELASDHDSCRHSNIAIY